MNKKYLNKYIISKNQCFIKIIRFFIILLGTLLCLQKIQASNFVENEIYKSALSQYHSKNFDEAMKNFERVLKINPSNNHAKFYMAEILYAKGKRNEALLLYKQVAKDKEFGILASQKIEIIQNSIKFEILLKDISLNLEYSQFQQAFSAIKEALKLFPNDINVHTYAFLAYILTNQLDNAKKTLEMLKKNSIKLVSNSNNISFSKFNNDHDLIKQKLCSMESLLYAIQTISTDPERALEYFKSITDKNFWIQPVKKTFIQFLKKNNLLREYEDYLLQELKDTENLELDKKSIEDELIRFYLDYGLYTKAMNILQKRNIDSIKDNLLLIECLIKLKEPKRALNMALSLYKLHSDDYQVVKVWISSMLAFIKEFKQMPQFDKNLNLAEINSNMSNSTNIVLEREIAKISKKYTTNQEILIKCLEIASDMKSEVLLSDIVQRIIKNPVSSEYIENFVDVCQKLTENNFRVYSTNLLEALLAMFPEDYRIQRMLAENYYLDERISEAYDLLMSAYKLEPTSYKTFNLLIDVMSALGKYNEALEMITQKLDDPYLDEIIKRQLKIKSNKLSNIVHASEISSTTNDVK